MQPSIGTKARLATGNVSGRQQRPPAVATYQPLVIVLVACCAGMVLDRYLPALGLFLPAAVSWAASVVGLGFWLSVRRGGRDRLSAWLLVLSVAAAGTAWHHVCWRLFSRHDLGHFARAAAAPVCVDGIALHAPQRVPAAPPDPLRAMDVGDRSRLDMQVVSIRAGTTWRTAGGKATLLVAGHLTGVRSGDRLRVFGRLSRTVPARNPGVFDFARHARANRQLCVLRSESPDCVQVRGTGSHWRVRRAVDSLRARGNGLLWGRLGAQQSGLAAAVLLGAREQVGAERTQAFVTTGTVHLLVVSGLHMGILAGALLFALRLGLLPRRPALLLVALLVVGYATLTEARPPVVRACVLVVVVCLARAAGRRPLAFNSLAAAALVVLALNPADLFRTGPQLSFLAVAALAWLSGRQRSRSVPDALEQLLDQVRPWPLRAARWTGHWIWQLTVAGSLEWLVVEPLVMARFHLFTPVAVLLSPLLWLPVATSLISGFGVLLLGWLIPPLGAVCAWLCDRSLAGIEHCVTVAAGVPGSHVWVPGPADWWLVGLYGGMALLLAFPRLRLPRRWCLALLAGWTALGFLTARGGSAPTDRLECTFLSLGHGCAVVVQLPGGHTVLYDCGSLGAPHSGARTIAGYLWSRGTTHLSAVVLSHADVDHYNALPELLERFSIGAVIVSPVMFEHAAPGLAVLRSALKAARVPVHMVRAGDRLLSGTEARIEVLHPPVASLPGGDNVNSLVLAIDYAGRRLLLPGDLEPPGLDVVIAQPAVDCDVLLAPHHGSNRSDPPGFAAWCAPEWVVVSGGDQIDSGGAARTYRRLGAKVLHTAEVGAVRFTVCPGEIRARTFLCRRRQGLAGGVGPTGLARAP